MLKIFSSFTFATLVAISLPLQAQTPRKSRVSPQVLPPMIDNRTRVTIPVSNLILPTPLVTPPKVILENRSSGCRVIADETINLKPNLCPRPVARLNPAPLAMSYPLPAIVPISSGFGWRVHPVTGISTFHQGIDLAASFGTPVLAAHSGEVVAADWLGGLGNAVVINHGDDSETRYGHLSQILVTPGQYVKQGTVIGLVGSTGMTTGPHLHFELWQRQVAVDASKLISG